jgi:hypothetical protein
MDKIDKLFDYLKDPYKFVLVISHSDKIQNKSPNCL